MIPGEYVISWKTCTKKYKFDSILIPGTSLGQMIAPRLAKRLADRPCGRGDRC
jgi:electron transfer flavoprotein alpha subunit